MREKVRNENFIKLFFKSLSGADQEVENLSNAEKKELKELKNITSSTVNELEGNLAASGSSKKSNLHESLKVNNNHKKIEKVLVEDSKNQSEYEYEKE